MKNYHILLLGFCLSATTTAFATVQTDTSIQGNLCTGFDCVDNEAFSAVGVTKLKENNVRISWRDLSAGTFQARDNRLNTYLEGEVGESWRVDANQSVNGGDNYFYISQFSLADAPVLSNGSAPDYDCDTPDFSLPSPFYPVIGLIPAGEPAETSTCQPYNDFVQLEALTLDGSAAGGVGLGQNAEVATGQVMVGDLTVQRRLARVAEAIEETDALIKAQLDAGLLQDRLRTADEIETLLDMAEAEIVALESAVAPFGKGGGGAAGWLLILLPLAGLKLRHVIARR